MKVITITYTTILFYGDLIVIIEDVYLIAVVEVDYTALLAEKIIDMPSYIRKGYVSGHWLSDRGTGLTNFDKKDLEVYQTAIDIYNDAYPDRPIEWWISDRVMSGYQWGGMSLHFRKHPDYKGDCGPFWEIYDNVRKDVEEMSKS